MPVQWLIDSALSAAHFQHPLGSWGSLFCFYFCNTALSAKLHSGSPTNLPGNQHDTGAEAEVARRSCSRCANAGKQNARWISRNWTRKTNQNFGKATKKQENKWMVLRLVVHRLFLLFTEMDISSFITHVNSHIIISLQSHSINTVNTSWTPEVSRKIYVSMFVHSAIQYWPSVCKGDLQSVAIGLCLPRHFHAHDYPDTRVITNQ